MPNMVGRRHYAGQFFATAFAAVLPATMTDHFQRITAAFASTVLSQKFRPLRLRWRPQEARFEQLLLVQGVDLREAWLEGLQAQLTCVSSDPELPLQALLGQPLGIEMVTDRGGLHHTNGIITDARACQADGALRIYQLTLQDALTIMEGRVNTRIFRQLSVPRILEVLLSEWRQRSPAVAMAFDFDLDALEDIRYPVRELCHQFNESDAHFIRRLCRREGIVWYVASPQPAHETSGMATDTPVHRLVFCDSAARLPRAAADTVRYHRNGATEERDAISTWNRQRRLVPGSVWRGSWDYKAVRMGVATSQSMLDQGEAGHELARILEDGLIEAPHAADDLDDHLRLTDARMLAHEGRSESFEGSGTVRNLAVGHWFVLEGHPDLRGQDATRCEFVVTSLHQQAENNFPKALQEAIGRLLPISMSEKAAHDTADMRYRNQLTCRRRNAPLTPHYDPRLHLPLVHPITALVVGPADEEVYCDELGRIKVQLQGLHAEDHEHAQGAGTSGHDQDSAFVRVSSAWAGAGYGHDVVPRVGMEVLIDFLGGDPDKMFVAGVLHNGMNLPARFSHGGGLPGNRFLSGIKSKEIDGARYNQLRLDDTPGQISTQLASEHQHSQINLGYLTEPRHDGQGADRGEGLETRTDGHGVLRGGKGVLITAQRQDRGRGRMLERAALLETLHSLQDLAQRLSQDAARHHAEMTDVGLLDQIRMQLLAWDSGDAATGKVRAGDADKVRHSLAEEKSTRISMTEHHSLVQASTAHQKTILIDYDHADGEHAVGYVMGLNSVTDYWDTRKHLFHDPRRGESWEGGGDELPGLKPLQDYACRICGEALISVSKNFVDAWNRVATADQKIQRTHDLRSPPAGLRKSTGKSTHRAQIVRTQPEEGDKTIQRLYRQATSFASNYIYIENQYFQYAEWAKYLKQLRRDFIAAWKAAGQPLKKLPDLHVFIVIPTPERKQMVPATHETVKALGHGTSMPNQDKEIERELALQEQQKELETYELKERNNGAPPALISKPKPLVPNTNPRSNEDIAKELDSLGIKTLVASLWTYDHAGDSKGEKYREIYIHSKLMIIDDAFFTLGSANLNLRSMAVDAEINIGCDDPLLSEKLRREVFAMHSGNSAQCDGGDGSINSIGNTFILWKRLLTDNKVKRNEQKSPVGVLIPFEDKRTSSIRLA